MKKRIEVGEKKVVETAGEKSSFMYVGELYLTHCRLVKIIRAK
jgi:hypothetical protein